MSYSSAISGMLRVPQEGQRARGHASSATETSADAQGTVTHYLMDMDGVLLRGRRFFLGQRRLCSVCRTGGFPS
jgi:hypothetical protein